MWQLIIPNHFLMFCCLGLSVPVINQSIKKRFQLCFYNIRFIDKKKSANIINYNMNTWTPNQTSAYCRILCLLHPIKARKSRAISAEFHGKQIHKARPCSYCNANYIKTANNYQFKALHIQLKTMQSHFIHRAFFVKTRYHKKLSKLVQVLKQ